MIFSASSQTLVPQVVGSKYCFDSVQIKQLIKKLEQGRQCDSMSILLEEESIQLADQVAKCDKSKASLSKALKAEKLKSQQYMVQDSASTKKIEIITDDCNKKVRKWKGRTIGVGVGGGLTIVGLIAIIVKK